MLITIHGLPPDMRYSDIKAILKDKCGLTEIILDNLVSEGKTKKVTVGVSDEGDAAILVRKINGLYLDGCQLYIEDVRKKQILDQPFRPSASKQQQQHLHSPASVQEQTAPVQQQSSTPEMMQAALQRQWMMQQMMSQAVMARMYAAQTCQTAQQQSMISYGTQGLYPSNQPTQDYNQFSDSGNQHFAGNQTGGGNQSYAGGNQSYAGGNSNFADGNQSYAGGNGSYAGGNQSYGGGNGSYAGGNQSYAGGNGSYAGGNQSYAGGNQSYAEGNSSYDGGNQSYDRGNTRFDQRKPNNPSDRPVDERHNRRSPSPRRGRLATSRDNSWTAGHKRNREPSPNDDYPARQPRFREPSIEKFIVTRELSGPRQNAPQNVGFNQGQHAGRPGFNQGGSAPSNFQFPHQIAQGPRPRQAPPRFSGNAAGPRPNEPNFRQNAPNFRQKAPNLRQNAPNLRQNSPNLRQNSPNKGQNPLSYKYHPKVMQMQRDLNLKQNAPNFQPNAQSSRPSGPGVSNYRPENPNNGPRTQNYGQNAKNDTFASKQSGKGPWQPRPNAPVGHIKKEKKIRISNKLMKRWISDAAEIVLKQMRRAWPAPLSKVQERILRQELKKKIINIAENFKPTKFQVLVDVHRNRFGPERDHKYMTGLFGRIERGEIMDEDLEATEHVRPSARAMLEEGEAGSDDGVELAPKAKRVKKNENSAVPLADGVDPVSKIIDHTSYKKTFKELRKMQAQELLTEDMYNLNPPLKQAMKEEVDTIISIAKAECMEPATELESKVCEYLIDRGIPEFEKLARLEVTKRLLGISTSLSVRVHYSKPAPTAALRAELTRRGVVAMRRSDRQRFWVAQCRDYAAYDDLLAARSFEVEGVTLKISPLHIIGPKEKEIEKYKKQKDQKIATKKNSPWFERKNESTRELRETWKQPKEIAKGTLIDVDSTKQDVSHTDKYIVEEEGSNQDNKQDSFNQRSGSFNQTEEEIRQAEDDDERFTEDDDLFTKDINDFVLVDECNDEDEQAQHAGSAEQFADDVDFIEMEEEDLEDFEL